MPPITFATSPTQAAVTQSMLLLMGMADESTEHVAAVLGISASALRQKIKGRIRWSMEDMDQLCAHFRLTLPELVDPHAAARIALDRVLADQAKARAGTATHESQRTAALYALVA